MYTHFIYYINMLCLNYILIIVSYTKLKVAYNIFFIEIKTFW